MLFLIVYNIENGTIECLVRPSGARGRRRLGLSSLLSLPLWERVKANKA